MAIPLRGDRGVSTIIVSVVIEMKTSIPTGEPLNPWADAGERFACGYDRRWRRVIDHAEVARCLENEWHPLRWCVDWKPWTGP